MQSGFRCSNIIDGFDVTRVFTHGILLYDVVLTFEDPLGVVNFPALEEIVWTAKFKECFWNDSRATVSGASELRLSHRIFVSTNTAPLSVGTLVVF